MFREKLLSGGQKAAEIYCASQPQWEYIVPALVLGIVLGAVVAGCTAWALRSRREGLASERNVGL